MSAPAFMGVMLGNCLYLYQYFNAEVWDNPDHDITAPSQPTTLPE